MVTNPIIINGNDKGWRDYHGYLFIVNDKGDITMVTSL